jgi:hypothetical protein
VNTDLLLEERGLFQGECCRREFLAGGEHDRELEGLSLVSDFSARVICCDDGFVPCMTGRTFPAQSAWNLPYRLQVRFRTDGRRRRVQQLHGIRHPVINRCGKFIPSCNFKKLKVGGKP